MLNWTKAPKLNVTRLWWLLADSPLGWVSELNRTSSVLGLGVFGTKGLGPGLDNRYCYWFLFLFNNFYSLRRMLKTTLMHHAFHALFSRTFELDMYIYIHISTNESCLFQFPLNICVHVLDFFSDLDLIWWLWAFFIAVDGPGAVKWLLMTEHIICINLVSNTWVFSSIYFICSQWKWYPESLRFINFHDWRWPN